ncbi:MAG: zinc ribbon domain-containing protein [Anaeromyxobacter sp.]
MPIYEYECPKCGRFDALQKMSAPALELHDVCGSPVKKLISAAGFAFKGSGFYITDYGGKNPAAITGNGEKAGEKKASDGGGGAKSDCCAGCPASKSAA